MYVFQNFFVRPLLNFCYLLKLQKPQSLLNNSTTVVAVCIAVVQSDASLKVAQGVYEVYGDAYTEMWLQLALM